MTFQNLRDVVPWGRSLDEYVAMFSLTPGDLGRSILDCGAGPASFAAEAHRQGLRVTAVDPIYRFSGPEIERRVEEVHPVMVAGMEAERDRFVWDRAGSPELVGERRLAAMRTFLADLERGRSEGRYVTAALPTLPFEDGAFHLALSSHFLFLYSEQLGLDFHLAAIDELLRVAGEVRVFPLLDLAGQPSALVGAVRARVQERGAVAEIVTVAFEFQRGGNQMLVVTRA